MLRSGNHLYRVDKSAGPLHSRDGGKTWFFTFRTADEWRQMFPDAVDDSATADESEDRTRETFGETLDEPIPDDLFELLRD